MLTPTDAAHLRWLLIWFGDCVDAGDPDRWFPPEPTKGGAESQEAYENRRVEYERTAHTLCADCPVKAECLNLALDEEADLPRTWIHGIRGGKAPWQRYRMNLHRQLIARQEVA